MKYKIVKEGDVYYIKWKIWWMFFWEYDWIETADYVLGNKYGEDIKRGFTSAEAAKDYICENYKPDEIRFIESGKVIKLCNKTN